MKTFQNKRNKKQKGYSNKAAAGNSSKKTSYPVNRNQTKWKKSEPTKKQEKEQQVHDSNNPPKEFSINKKWQKKGKHKRIKVSQSSQDQHIQNGAHKNSLSAKTLTKNVNYDKRVPNARNENRKKKLKMDKSQNSPAEPLIKVQTHAALYKNPEEFSSNWKKLLKEIEKNKEPKKRKTNLKPAKRKANLQKSSQPLKKRRKNEKFRHSEINTTTQLEIKKPDIWFDDVDEDLLDLEVKKLPEEKTKKRKSKNVDTKENSNKSQNRAAAKEETTNPLVKDRAADGLTKAVAMDCEMVGVGQGGMDSVLARVSIVNQYGRCIYDKYVKPKEHVTDFRTQFSGVRPENLKNAEEFSKVQKDIYDIIKGRILVGHALHNDLKVLFLDHPRKKIRDTARYRAFRKIFQGKTPSLKKLTEKLLSVKVQGGEHNSVEDAQAAMRLYTLNKVQWEKEIKLKRMKGKFVNSTVVTKTDT